MWPSLKLNHVYRFLSARSQPTCSAISLTVNAILDEIAKWHPREYSFIRLICLLGPCEFHDLDQITDRYSNKNIASILRKVSRSFSPVYIAANNETGFKKYDDIVVPRNIEVTYMRRDRLPDVKSFLSSIELNDFGSYKNNIQKKPIMFSNHWFGP